MVSALVESANVSFTFEKQRITSSDCDYCEKKIWCCHIIAAILHRIKYAKKVLGIQILAPDTYIYKLAYLKISFLISQPKHNYVVGI